MFFGPIGKTRWPPWPLIGRDIFDFFSETAERNSMKVDRKQDLNFFYQVCVFRTDRKNKMAALASDWLRHFRLLWNRWMKFNENLTGSKISMSSTKFVFLGPIGKTRWPPWLLICWVFFDLVAHCTQVHDMWPFGPLVHNSTETVWEWEHFIDYPIEKSGNSNASNIAM